MARLSESHHSPLVVQLTDSHLFAEADGCLLGLNTADSLMEVVRQVRAAHARIDLLLGTGDLAQAASRQAYERFHATTEGLSEHARWLPGNHDDVSLMRDFCRDHDLLEPVVDIGAWRLILLDSTVPGEVHGWLSDDQLALLERALAEAPERHALVTFHHHPVPVGCAWMEPLGVRNAQALFAVLDRFPQVRAVLWGHIHQEFEQERHGVRLMASPSTGLQFEPGSVDFRAGEQQPGYRWLRLHDDGSFETGVSRVTGTVFTIDREAGGY